MSINVYHIYDYVCLGGYIYNWESIKILVTPWNYFSALFKLLIDVADFFFNIERGKISIWGRRP